MTDHDPSGSKINRLKAPTAATLSLLSVVALSACGDKVEAVPSPTETTTSDTTPTALETPKSTPSESPTMDVSKLPTDSPVPTTEAPTPSVDITPLENWTAIDAEFTQTMDSWEEMSRGDKINYMMAFSAEQIPSYNIETVYKPEETEEAVREFFSQLNLINNLWGDVTVEGHKDYASNLVEGVTRSTSDDMVVEQLRGDLSYALDFLISDECTDEWCYTSRKDTYEIDRILGVSDRSFPAVDLDGKPFQAIIGTVLLKDTSIQPDFPDGTLSDSALTKTVLLDVTSSKPLALEWLHGTDVEVEYNGPGTGVTYVGDLLEEENQNIK